jgi:hypothetical protein
MTLGEGKRRVMMLLDEYSAGGEISADEDIGLKMADFFDMAQKDMANFKRIIRLSELTPAGAGGSMCSWLLPEDFSGAFRVWQDGRCVSGWAVTGDRLVTKRADAVTLEYFALPSSLGPDTPDSYEFEVSEDAAACLPFFVAAQQLLPDLVVDYGGFYNTYLQMRSALDTSLPESGFGGVRQALFGRR